jgi:hypothetical protein
LNLLHQCNALHNYIRKKSKRDMAFNEFIWHPKFVPQDILIIDVILNYQT